MVNRMKNKIRIYQIPFEKLHDVKYSFMNWEYARDKFNINDYELVAEWQGNVDRDSCEEYLERIFSLGNNGTLQNLVNNKMRSISMSDVIEIDGIRWYCDTCGFKWAGTCHEI